MADDPTEEEELTLEAQEAGFAFKAEMWATDTLMGYWMYLLGGLIVVLGAILFYGQYTNYMVDQQRAYAKAVVHVETTTMDSPVAQLVYAQASGQPLDEAALLESAVALEGIGASGAANCEALLKAAEIYRLISKPEDQRRALQNAANEGIEPFAFQAETALANLDLEAGSNDQAIARLKALMDKHADYLGEQAAMDLGMVHEHLGQSTEARGVYEAFLEKWKTSPRRDLVQKRLNALGAG